MSAEKSKTRSIQLKMPHSAEAAKPSAKDNAAGMANNGPAHAVVFREKEFNCRYHGKLYIDGKELARSRNGRYFTVTLPPGKHIIGGKGGSQSATVDSTSPSTYYLRVTDVSAWMCFYDVTAIDAEAAMSMIPRMRPAEAKDILMPEIVSLEPISVK
jgi:hypothetical protein